MSMKLIPGGSFIPPTKDDSQTQKNVSIKPFYMDETPVTNHQYVEFLNQTRMQIRIEQDIVYGGKEIWLFLGEVKKDYTPIVYKNGKFHITKPGHASCPVLRVSGYGASAYARFYAKRLPTQAEWLFTLIRGEQIQPAALIESTEETVNQPDTEKTAILDMMHEHHGVPGAKPSSPVAESSPFVPTPVIDYEANAFGIRGLNEDLSEWALKSRPETEAQRAYIIMGKAFMPGKNTTKIYKPISRHPWEAFDRVSFRCALDADNQ